MKVEPGTIYLTGAGPGDPDLITLRGLEVLRAADAVVHDRLVAPELLAHARPDALRENVGKAPGVAGRTQDEINALMIGLAREGKSVCRLKGGDPFVFGRGGEEAAAARAAGVPWVVIPGVTAAVAAPALAGIPVTHRGVAASVTVVTGHEDPAHEAPAVAWGALAAASGTIVIMMGVDTLPRIAASLLEGGRAPDEPAAVIERGAMPEQRVVVADLGTIAERAKRERIESPAVIVVGRVVTTLSEAPP